MRMRGFFAMVATGAVMAGLSVISAPAASAHEPNAGIYLCGDRYNERCGYGGVTNSHTRVYSCDTHGDAYGFRTYYLLRNGGTGYVDDANGSSSGCSGIYPGSSSNPI